MQCLFYGKTTLLFKEADEINELARKWDVDFTKYEGGIYSSEWVWAKVLHTLRKDEAVKGAAVSWIEYCDWLPAVLTGKTAIKEVKRSRCAAGHKAIMAYRLERSSSGRVFS